MQVVIQTEDFDLAEEYEQLRAQNRQSGAIVFFVGLVRDQISSLKSGDGSDAAVLNVERLELEHYAQMTEALCQQIVGRAITRFGVSNARVVHRVGVLNGGDQIVFVGVAGQHRAETFQAAEYIMDYLKSEATIWKKEVVGDSARWLGVKDKDAQAAKRWELDSEQTAVRSERLDAQPRLYQIAIDQKIKTLLRQTALAKRITDKNYPRLLLSLD